MDRADGSITAFEVRMDVTRSQPMLVTLWISRELHAPGVPVVANGVLYAFQSGKDSTETRAAGAGRGVAGGRGTGDGRGAGAAGGGPAAANAFNHFSGNPVIAGGTVYAVTWDRKLYAFGLKQ